MPPWQKARIDSALLAAPPLSPAGWPGAAHVAGKGSTLTISFRPVPLLPLRLTWVAFISEFEWDRHFCDEQRSGPLAYWRHCHSVSAEKRKGIDGSLVTDQVTYALPLHWLGDLANAIAIHRQMKSTFSFRQHRLLELLSAK
jgi:ligand-binding SRPBCC domain-containing protein